MREFLARAVPAHVAAEPSDQSPKSVLGAVLAVGALACAGVAGLPPAAQAQSEGPVAEQRPEAEQPAEPEAAAPAHVTKVTSIRPARRKVVRKRFKPAARPGPRGVRRIIHLEARRWNISPSSLSRRVACESNYRWYAGNGAYQGLLQFASSTFYRGLSSIRSREVRFVRERKRMVHGERIVQYSDGSLTVGRGVKRRQKVVTVYSGTLPRNPSVTHGWTQLRIGSQAIRGLSAVGSGEWACPA